MHLWAGAEILFGVCEEIMGACADNEGAANFGVCNGELGVSR